MTVTLYQYALHFISKLITNSNYLLIQLIELTPTTLTLIIILFKHIRFIGYTKSNSTNTNSYTYSNSHR